MLSKMPQSLRSNYLMHSLYARYEYFYPKTIQVLNIDIVFFIFYLYYKIENTIRTYECERNPSAVNRLSVKGLK
jgi:hypothetical protein